MFFGSFSSRSPREGLKDPALGPVEGRGSEPELGDRLIEAMDGGLGVGLPLSDGVRRPPLFVSTANDPYWPGGLPAKLLELEGSPLPIVRLSMVSLVVFRTPFFTSSFLRSALAAGPTVGAVNIVMTLSRATSRTMGSESSKALTRTGTHARNGKVGQEARSSVRYSMLCGQ